MPKGQTTKDLQDYLSKFRWLRDLCRAGSITAFMAFAVYHIGPEVDKSTLDCSLAAIVAILTSMLVFVFVSGRSQKAVKRLLPYSFLISATFVVAYCISVAFLTGIDSTGDRYVKGFEYSEKIQEFKKMVADKRQAGDLSAQDYSDDELVANSDNNPRIVWIPSTISIAALLLHSLLMFVIIAATCFVSLVVLILPHPPLNTNTTSGDRKEANMPGEHT